MLSVRMRRNRPQAERLKGLSLEKIETERDDAVPVSGSQQGKSQYWRVRLHSPWSETVVCFKRWLQRNLGDPLSARSGVCVRSAKTQQAQNGQRKSDNFIVAMKRSNFRGAKEVTV